MEERNYTSLADKIWSNLIPSFGDFMKAMVLFLMRAILVQIFIILFSKVFRDVLPSPNPAVSRNSNTKLADTSDEAYENNRMENDETNITQQQLRCLGNQKEKEREENASKTRDNDYNSDEAQTKRTRKGRIVRPPLRFRR